MKLDKYSVAQSSKSIDPLTKEPSHYAESYGKEARQVYWREMDSVVASKMSLTSYAKSWMISFVSNDYLGLSQHPQVQSDAIRAINQFGTGFCVAPSVGGYSSLQKRLEEGLSKLLHTEDTLLFNSGFSTNIELLFALVTNELMRELTKMGDEIKVVRSQSLRKKLTVYTCYITKRNKIR